MKTFYTQEFFEYMALSASTMTAMLSRGNIDGCTITDNIVLGPPASLSGKKQKVKTEVSEKECIFTSPKLDKRITTETWDFSTSTDYTTTTEYFYEGSPSAGMGSMVFSLCFNTQSTYLAIPFETTANFPSSITDDYGGTLPSIYWELNPNENYWDSTVACPTIINGSSIGLSFNETAPEFQCTIPSFVLGFGSSPEEINGRYNKPFGGFILVNDSIMKEDETKLIIYAGILDEEIAVGSSTSVFQSIISMDVVII